MGRSAAWWPLHDPPGHSLKVSRLAPESSPAERAHPGAGLAGDHGHDPPTAPIVLRAQPSRMEDLTAHALGLALRIGESMLVVGASSADVTATVLRVAAGFGLAPTV
jgi:hypothetical protein